MKRKKLIRKSRSTPASPKEVAQDEQLRRQVKTEFPPAQPEPFESAALNRILKNAIQSASPLGDDGPPGKSSRTVINEEGGTTVMDAFVQRATKYLQARFPTAVVGQRRHFLSNPFSSIQKEFCVLVAYDHGAAVKQVMIGVSNLGSHGDFEVLAREARALFTKFKSSVGISGGNALEGDLVGDHQMVDSPRILIYTDSLCVPRDDVFRVFNENGWVISLIDESNLYLSALISFGGPDETAARTLDTLLRSRGVKTWFFPNDSIPGDKLHRTMSNAVGSQDRTILLCSKASLDRPGVQNELERVLEREAREGGASLLIPVSIDRYVFDEWNPKERDRAEQLRTRVIMTFPENWADPTVLSPACEPLLKALRRSRA